MSDGAITSTSNPTVKQAMTLRDSKARKADQLTLIDGVREIQRAYDAGIQMQKVFVCPGLAKGREEKALLNLLKQNNIKMIEVTESILEKISFGQRVEGFVAVAEIPQRSLAQWEPSKEALYVILQGLEKPGNIGAILRTCDAAGIDGLLLVDTKTDLFNPNVIRASTGTVFSVPTAVADELAIKNFLSNYKIRTCGLFPEGSKMYTDVDLTGPMAIVLGSEDQGLNDFWRKEVNTHIKIPMRGKADSLNVSACAAIVIYEALRQRGVSF